jgi:aryl-alcohol dehydrogenase-like predicted oxidoreductase
VVTQQACSLPDRYTLRTSDLNRSADKDIRETVLQYNSLGRSGLQVSAMALGTMNFGGGGVFGNCGSDEAGKILDRFLEVGGNLIDTADVYNRGESETVIGELIKRKARDTMVLATKAGLPTGPGPNDRGLSRRHLTRALEASLRRLQTDYVDLYQCHHWDTASPIDETLTTLDAFVRSGKVRYIGCSNFTAAQIIESQWTAQRQFLTPFVSAQSQYSLTARSIEAEIAPTCGRHGLGLLTWSPLAGGLLARNADAVLNTSADTRINRMRSSSTLRDRDWASYITNSRHADVAKAVGACATESGIAPAAVAVAWLRAQSGSWLTSVIVGPRNVDHLDSYLSGFSTDLPAASVEMLDNVSAFATAVPITGRQRNILM